MVLEFDVDVYQERNEIPDVVLEPAVSPEPKRTLLELLACVVAAVAVPGPGPSSVLAPSPNATL